MDIKFDRILYSFNSMQTNSKIDSALFFDNIFA